MLAGPLLLAASPAVTAAPEVPPLPSPVAEDASDAIDMAALRAWDDARASRGQTRPTPVPSVAPAPPAEVAAPVAPAPAPPSAEPAPVAPPAVVATLWAAENVNVRSGPTADTERVGSLAFGAQVGVTGTTADGWTQVVLDGTVGWVKTSYLSEAEPVAEPEPEAAAAVSDESCSISSGIEPNLSSNARAVYRAVCAAYGGSVSAFGGYRPGDGGDHGSGRAVDIMVSGEAGWEIARYLQANAGELGISYLIYEQQYWPVGSPAGAWEYMEDRGGATANHFDHVHVSVR